MMRGSALRADLTARAAEYAAGHEACLRQRPEHVERGDLGGLAGTPEGSVRSELRELVRQLAAARLERRPEGPGATALTLMPFGASCFDSAFEKFAIAALVMA